MQDGPTIAKTAANMKPDVHIHFNLILTEIIDKIFAADAINSGDKNQI
jgi:hypothetical protein